jgi:hypothetical protein
MKLPTLVFPGCRLLGKLIPMTLKLIIQVTLTWRVGKMVKIDIKVQIYMSQKVQKMPPPPPFHQKKKSNLKKIGYCRRRRQQTWFEVQPPCFWMRRSATLTS